MGIGGFFMSKVNQNIAYTAILCALAAILNMLTIVTSIKYFAISFTYIPCFIAGYKLKPANAFLVGFLGDLIAAIIRPLGPYLPLIGLASGLLGLIPALVFKFSRLNNAANIAISFLLTLIVCTSGLNTLALYLAYSKGGTFWAYLALRLPYQSIVVALNAIIVLALLPIIDRLFTPKLK